MKDLKKKLRGMTERVLNIITVISAILLASSVVCYVFNCFMRYVVRAPFAWPEEYCTYIVVLMVYIITCRMEFFDAQLCIGVIDAWAGKCKPLRIALFVIQAFVTIFIYSALIKIATDVIAQQERYGTISPILQIPMTIFFFLITICFVMVIVVWVIKLITWDFDKEAERDE